MPIAKQDFVLYNRKVLAGESFEIPQGESEAEWRGKGLIDGEEMDGAQAAAQGLTTTNSGNVPEGNLPPPVPVGTVANEGMTAGQPVVVANEGDAPNPTHPVPGNPAAPEPGAPGGPAAPAEGDAPAGGDKPQE